MSCLSLSQRVRKSLTMRMKKLIKFHFMIDTNFTEDAIFLKSNDGISLCLMGTAAERHSKIRVEE